MLEQYFHEFDQYLSYYEIVRLRNTSYEPENYFVLRNGTDEGLNGALKFKDTDVRVLLERASYYFRKGPEDHLIDAAREIEAADDIRVQIFGDSLYLVVSEELEDGMREKYHYRYEFKNRIYDIEYTNQPFMNEFCYDSNGKRWSYNGITNE